MFTNGKQGKRALIKRINVSCRFPFFMKIEIYYHIVSLNSLIFSSSEKRLAKIDIDTKE